MNKARITAILLLLSVGLAVWWFFRSPTVTRPVLREAPAKSLPAEKSSPVLASDTAAISTPNTPLPEASASLPGAPESSTQVASESANDSAASAVEPATALEQVQTTLRDYRAAFGENPVGTNAEITATLLGGNAKKIQFPVPVGSSVNGKGELVDRWGTPYFFHQLARDRMDIISAGPDRILGTGDDLTQH